MEFSREDVKRNERIMALIRADEIANDARGCDMMVVAVDGGSYALEVASVLIDRGFGVVVKAPRVDGAVQLWVGDSWEVEGLDVAPCDSTPWADEFIGE